MNGVRDADLRERFDAHMAEAKRLDAAGAANGTVGGSAPFHQAAYEERLKAYKVADEQARRDAPFLRAWRAEMAVRDARAALEKAERELEAARAG